MNEIFALKTSAYSEWKKEDPLCLSCISQILRDHLIDWWVDRRRKGELHGRFNAHDSHHCMSLRGVPNKRELLVSVQLRPLLVHISILS